MSDLLAVKFVEGEGDGLIEGLILPYGGPRPDGNDLAGSHFTKSTDFALDWFPSGGRPGLYRHGFDPDLGLSVIGREVKSWGDDKGVWLRAQLDTSHEYWAEVKELIDQGRLFLSSGAVDHLVKATKDGQIKVWPWVEWSLVPNPAHPEAVAYPVKSVDAIEHLAQAEVEVPAALKQSIDSVNLVLDGTLAAVKEALNPQALHDAAVKSGAKCEEDTKPGPVKSETGGVDLEALTARLAEAAGEAAQQAVKSLIES